MSERLFKVISQVLNVPLGEINIESSPDTIEGWDSLKHMNLIIALEEEFEIEFNDEEIVDSVNFALIFTILKAR